MKCRKIIFEIPVIAFLLVFMSNLLPAKMIGGLANSLGELAEEPGKLIMETVGRGVTILKDPSLKGNEKIQERRQRLWEELSPVFNFEEMSKRALGRHWEKRTPVEKKEFVELFTSIIKDTYIGETDVYSDEKFVYLRERQDNNYAKVQTKFITNTGTEISIDYSLINQHGKWSIYDVVIEGVSLVTNYRSQFYSILAKSSYEKLVQLLKEKEGKK